MCRTLCLALSNVMRLARTLLSSLSMYPWIGFFHLACWMHHSLLIVHFISKSMSLTKFINNISLSNCPWEMILVTGILVGIIVVLIEVLTATLCVCDHPSNFLFSKWSINQINFSSISQPGCWAGQCRMHCTSAARCCQLLFLYPLTV